MSRVLVIPDVHQDILFLSRILDRENLDRFDQVVFLGDYFDANIEAFAGEGPTRLTAQFLHQLVNSYPKKVKLLWGNHDIIYCRLREYVLREDPKVIMEKAGPLDLKETFQRALWINETWPGDMWFRMELAVVLDDWLLSHAGIHPDFWNAALPAAEALVELKQQWNDVIGNLFENEDHRLLEAGQARGGTLPAGGPIWCDWDEEFVDGHPYRQLVGHTGRSTPRQNGRSWCIDCSQQSYCIMEEGALIHVNLNGSVSILQER